MNGQSTCRFYLIFLATVGAVRAQGGFFDFSNGMIDAMKGPCEQATGVWRQEDAINYSVEGGLKGPQDGKVIVSDSSTTASSCLRIPGGLQQIQKNFTIKLYVFLPEAHRRPLGVNFVTDTASSPASTVEPFVAGWNEITMSIPDPNTVKPPYPGPYTVELWAYRNVKFIALRWFGISDKEMPFPPETTSTEASTSEEPAIETTTVEVTDETTTDLMDESTSTTSIETDPPERTTAASPQPTAQPPQPVFPDLWSLLLGIVIGILLTSLAVFVATCFWWVWGTPGSKIIIANNPAYTLPRLEVTSNSSQKSITGSMGSQTSSADPFWIKSKGWAHIP